MFSRPVCRVLFAVLAVAAARCAPLHPYRVEAVPTQHIVMVESSGLLMDPTGSVICSEDTLQDDNDAFRRGNGKKQERSRFVEPPKSYSWKPCNGKFNGLRMRPLPKPELYIDDVFKGIDAYYGPPRAGKQVRKIALIIHGGLNTNHSSIDRAQQLSQRVLDSGYYPIFINWQSNLPRALLEHTVRVRQGDDLGALRGAPLAGPYLLADLGRGLVRTPVIWAYAAKNDFDRLKLAVRRYFSDRGWLGVKLQPRQTEKIYDHLRELRQACIDQGTPAKKCEAVDVQRGIDRYRLRDHVRNHAVATPTAAIPPQLAFRAFGSLVAPPWGHLLWVPLKYLTAPLLDGLGSAAWEDMQRHAALGFRRDGTRTANRDDEPGEGGLSLFTRTLEERTNDAATACSAERPDAPCIEWHINLISHSMGAIVANHLLRNAEDLKIDHIVYMAAACSVREYEDSVLPYMRQPAGRDTEMWHLVLNDLAEVRDQYFFELPPSGSLLVWVDHFFTQPHTRRDRTAGRWDNLARFLETTPRRLRSRIHVRAFDGTDELRFEQPQHHDAFLAFNGDPAQKFVGTFWDPQFWKTDMTDLKAKQEMVAAAPAGQ